MPPRQLPVQVDFIVSGARRLDGTVLDDGFVVAVDPFRMTASGDPLPKEIWKDPLGTMLWSESKVSLNTDGFPPEPVYADGPCDFLLFTSVSPPNPPTYSNKVETKRKFFQAHEVLNVLDFGAIPNTSGIPYNIGIEPNKKGNSGDDLGFDNTDALQAAIDSSARQPGARRR